MKIAHEILRVRGARELGEVLAAVGLAQNLAALKALADDGRLEQSTVLDAIQKYGIDPDRQDPVTL